MTEKDWLLRIIFLETIAGVPGMVGGMLRHLRSLRKLEKEGRWIETLLEEAENERMHLMTFMAIKKPKLFTRMLIVGAQGIFCNAFFFAYLMYFSLPSLRLWLKAVLPVLVIGSWDISRKRLLSRIPGVWLITVLAYFRNGPLRIFKSLKSQRTTGIFLKTVPWRIYCLPFVRMKLDIVTLIILLQDWKLVIKILLHQRKWRETDVPR